MASIAERVARAAEAALREHGYVAPVDVLVSLGLLAPVHRDRWRQGRVPHLEGEVQTGLGKASTAMTTVQRGARGQGLQPSETAYVARPRDRRALRFSVSGKPEIELAHRTHWVSPALSEAKRARLQEKASRPPDLVVISPLRDGEVTQLNSRHPSCRFVASAGRDLTAPGAPR
ncbi:hypothetical protein ACFSBG_03940 [Georgenia yuyongxinii]|uniref:hypothetical protein n=1 Tax=Georgenia yuyongxinii TaxID=2589797 RepID=UPI0015D428A1|nr:hypothetical protein [Georgenia yuyongxinii]